MRKYLAGVAILMLSFMVCFSSDISLAQEEEEEEEMEYSWGTVSSVSSNQIVVTEYVYSSGEEEEVDVTYTMDPKVKLENVNSLKDIAIGDSVEIDYVIREGKRVAKVITVEKEPEYYLEEEEEIES